MTPGRGGLGRVDGHGEERIGWPDRPRLRCVMPECPIPNGNGLCSRECSHHTASAGFIILGKVCFCKRDTGFGCWRRLSCETGHGGSQVRDSRLHSTECSCTGTATMVMGMQERLCKKDKIRKERKRRKIMYHTCKILHVVLHGSHVHSPPRAPGQATSWPASFLVSWVSMICLVCKWYPVLPLTTKKLVMACDRSGTCAAKAHALVQSCCTQTGKLTQLQAWGWDRLSNTRAPGQPFVVTSW